MGQQKTAAAKAGQQGLGHGAAHMRTQRGVKGIATRRQHLGAAAEVQRCPEATMPAVAAMAILAVRGAHTNPCRAGQNARDQRRWRQFGYNRRLIKIHDEDTIHGMRVLGIETSCDETGVALYDAAAGLLAHTLHSQVDLHAEYGGVVPEIASRDHVRKLLPLVGSLPDQQPGWSAVISTALPTPPGPA